MGKKRVSFEDKKVINETIQKLMQEGYGETEARLTVAKWLDRMPTK